MEHTTNKPIKISDFDFSALYAAQPGMNTGLVLLIATDGGWAQEPAGTNIPEQLTVIRHHMGRPALEAHIRAEVAQWNSYCAQL